MCRGNLKSDRLEPTGCRYTISYVGVSDDLFSSLDGLARVYMRER